MPHNQIKEVKGVVDAAPFTAANTSKRITFSVPPKPEEFTALCKATDHALPRTLALWRYHVEQARLAQPQNTLNAALTQEPQSA